MKSILRLYVNTSKGNDSVLYKELTRFNIRPKYDNHLHAFFFDAPLPYLFKVAHRVLTAENFFIQIGQPIPATSQTVFAQRLERIQFKNYLPLGRGLIQNLTLNILVRDTKYPLSDNVMSSLIHNALSKESIKKQYFQNILKDSTREALPNYYDMKQIVQRKWEQDDEEIEINNPLLEKSIKQKPLIESSSTSNTILKEPIKSNNVSNNQQQPLPFCPKLTVYINRNKARLLLKVNEQEMYKLGWKRRVGWAPVRESIATAVITQTRILQTESEIVLWDPFCGSGTIPIVSAAIYYGAFVRIEADKFNWKHWPIFKEEYLNQYFEAQKGQKKNKQNNLKIICTDINFQASNYTLANLKQFSDHLTQQNNQKDNSFPPIYKRIKPTEQWTELRKGQWVVGCSDFQKIAPNVLIDGRKVNIITNLPYIKSRSVDHMPLSQLLSVYRRFSKMLKNYKDKIANVFIIIDNSNENVQNPNHFLSVSEEKWILVNSFESGGLPIGLYAWQHNQIQSKYQDLTAMVQNLKQDVRSLNQVPQQEIATALSTYRKKVQEIQNKTYYLPRHLIKIKRGWRRVVEKRRRRHLLRAYELFSKRRDKVIAFSQYARKKLEVNMLRRGAVWKRRNIRLLNGLPVKLIEKQLAKEFEGRIQEALKKNQEKQNYRKLKAEQTNRQIELQKSKINGQNKLGKRVQKKTNISSKK